MIEYLMFLRNLGVFFEKVMHDESVVGFFVCWVLSPYSLGIPTDIFTDKMIDL